MRGIDETGTGLLAGLACALLLGACNSHEETELSIADDLITFDGAQYALRGCELFATDAEMSVTSITTGIDGRCLFARQSDKSPQIHVTDNGAYALVVASVPHESDSFCDTTIRAVRLDASAPKVSADEQNIMMCSSGPFDEVMIVTLSDSVPTD